MKIKMEKRHHHRKILLLAMFCWATGFCYAQTPTDSIPGDPGGIDVYTVQNLSFGSFANGSNGGSITITPEGARSATGDIVLLNMGAQFFNAVFEIECPPGAIVSLFKGPDVSLTGSNGGSLSLKIGDSNPASPFVTSVAPPGRTQVNVGGTLTIGSPTTSVPGNYTGNFYITFNQE